MTEDKPTKKRKSRFDDVDSSQSAVAVINPPAIDASIALAKATEISKNILNATLNNASSTPVLTVEQKNSIKAAEIQAQLATQIANVSHLLKNVQHQLQPNPLVSSTSSLTAQIQQVIKDKKTSYRPLLLDSQGREVDEQGNVVKSDFSQVKTLAVNNQIVQAQRKKENPYLAHRQIPQPILPTSSIQTIANTAVSITDGTTNSAINSSSTQVITNLNAFQSALTTAVAAGEIAQDNQYVDDRVVIGDRSIRSKKALKFHEPGKYIQKEEEEHLKEERKIIAGYASGRKALGISAAHTHTAEDTAADDDESTDTTLPAGLSGGSEDECAVPRPIDDGVLPSMEWWDELFLPKTTRENRKKYVYNVM